MGSSVLSDSYSARTLASQRTPRQDRPSDWSDGLPDADDRHRDAPIERTHMNTLARAIRRLSDCCRPAHRGGRHGVLRPRGGHAGGGDWGGGDRTHAGRDGRADPGNGVAVRRSSGSRASLDGRAVHRRLRRAGHASLDSRRRDVQPHPLLHRQGAGTGLTLRGAEAVRERSERGPEDRQPQGARGDRAAAARSAATRPSRAARSTWSPPW